MYHPDIDQVKKLKGRRVPIFREMMADTETPVSVYLKINKGRPSFLLESVAGGSRIARYSFIGTEPEAVISTAGTEAESPLSKIEKALDLDGYVKIPGLPRFAGGAVGYMAYETVSRFEKIDHPGRDCPGLPESMFMLAGTVIVFDHLAHRIKIVSHVELDGNIEANYERAVGRIEEILARLEEPLAENGHIPQPNPSSAEPASSFSRQEFTEGVLKIKDYIVSGEAIQVVLSQRLARFTCAKPLDIYRSLRSINPSPYMFYFDFMDFQVIGASPEILVRVEDGEITTRPLAGTRRRGRTNEEDLALEKELTTDEKERAEHVMLVDLGRNDIGRVAVPGTVEVAELMNIERYSHVMHMVTNVKGKLKPNLTAFDGLKACFPAGTVSGAPKVRAMQIIAELEPEKRGVYAGAAGYFSYSGNMDMAIAIRTMVLKDGFAYVQAGAGIVYDSQPDKEYKEINNKARVLFSAIDEAEKRAMGRKTGAPANR